MQTVLIQSFSLLAHSLCKDFNSFHIEAYSGNKSKTANVLVG